MTHLTFLVQLVIDKIWQHDIWDVGQQPCWFYRNISPLSGLS